MALTITLGGNAYSTAGHKVRVEGTATFDSSYLSGGESLTAAMVGLRTIDSITFELEDGYVPRYDYTNNLVLMYYGSTATLAALGTSIPSGTSTTTQALYTYTVPAGLLNQAGQGISYDFWGTTASATTTLSVLLTHGTSLLVSTGTTVANNVAWHINGVMTTIAVSTQDAISRAANGVVVNALTHTAGGEILTAANTLALQVVTATSGHAILSGYRVSLINPVSTNGELIQVLSGTDLSAAVVRFTAYGV